MKQPGECYLSLRCSVPGDDAGQRAGRAEKVAPGDRSPGEESEAVRFTFPQDIIGCTVGEVEAVLDRGDVDQLSGTAQLVDGYL